MWSDWKVGGACLRVLVVFHRTSSMHRMAGRLSDDLPKHRANGGCIQRHELERKAINSYMVGVTRRKSRFSSIAALPAKSMWCTGRFLLSRGSTDGESTPSKRSPRPSSVRTQFSESVGQSSGNAPLAIVRPVRRRRRSTKGRDWIFSSSSISISLVRLETSTTIAGP